MKHTIHGAGALAAVLAAAPVAAETFCVTTAAQLQAAFTTAQSNGENDVIRIRTGTYAAPQFGFKFDAIVSEDFDLEISGGWHPFGHLACGWHDEVPWSTLLTGNGTTRVMLMQFGGTAANVRIGRLIFMNGHYESSNSAGLEITYASGAGGNVTVERNVFLNNTSSLGSGLLVMASGPKVAVVNNLFILNEANTNLSAVYMVNTGLQQQNEIAFTNNTVISNHLGQFASEDASAAYLVADSMLVINNNFWDNDGFDLDPGASGVRSIFNNNYESLRLYGTEDLEDNISVAPEYESGFLNFTPVRSSALVDAGREPLGIDPGWSLDDIDLNGAPRKIGLHADIGAFENDRIFVDGFDPHGPFGHIE